jgi:hypothetical protein
MPGGADLGYCKLLNGHGNQIIQGVSREACAPKYWNRGIAVVCQVLPGYLHASISSLSSSIPFHVCLQSMLLGGGAT